MNRTIDNHAIMKSQLQVCTGYGDNIPISRSSAPLAKENGQKTIETPLLYH